MENGPTSIRPDTILDPIRRRMHERKVGTILVTTSDGELIGVLYREDADRRWDAFRASLRGESA